VTKEEENGQPGASHELHLSNDAYLHVAKRFDDVIKALP
jgi:hypothetical protein